MIDEMIVNVVIGVVCVICVALFILTIVNGCS